MNIINIRKYLSSRIGFRIVVIYYGSRNKIEIYEGILYKIYRNIFIIKMANNEKKCFSYIDIITKSIKISV